MTTPPDAMFVVDSHNEQIAVREARRMGVPVIAVVDTNSDPDQIQWVIPGNDDALRAIRLFTSKIADAVVEGRSAFEQTQIAEQKVEEGAPGGDNAEYVDTSAYEAYEKQEGDFVEAVEGIELPAEVPAEAEQAIPADGETPA
jgi:small subunit ribosomal protein S2